MIQLLFIYNIKEILDFIHRNSVIRYAEEFTH
jgi:hypothetical protein